MSLSTKLDSVSVFRGYLAFFVLTHSYYYQVRETGIINYDQRKEGDLGGNGAPHMKRQSLAETQQQEEQAEVQPPWAPALHYRAPLDFAESFLVGCFILCLLIFVCLFAI